MTASIVQSVIVASTGYSFTATLPNATTAGNRIVVVMTAESVNSTFDIATPTDSKGNTYTREEAEDAGPLRYVEIGIWDTGVVTAGTAGTTVVTLSDTGGPGCCCTGDEAMVWVAEVSGAPPAGSILDGFNYAISNTHDGSGSGSITTTNANDLLIGVAFGDFAASQSFTVDSGWTQVKQTSGAKLGSDYYTMLVESQSVSSTGTYSINPTPSAQPGYGEVLAIFAIKPAPPAGSASLQASFTASAAGAAKGSATLQATFTGTAAGTESGPTGSASLIATFTASAAGQVLGHDAASYTAAVLPSRWTVTLEPARFAASELRSRWTVVSESSRWSPNPLPSRWNTESLS